MVLLPITIDGRSGSYCYYGCSYCYYGCSNWYYCCCYFCYPLMSPILTTGCDIEYNDDDDDDDDDNISYSC